jgi:lysophospholipase L1-like esterase
MLKSPLPAGPVVLLVLGLAACGGGGTSPSGPSNTPTPSVPTHSVTATVFYDQNGNGQLDGNENARVPGVDVVIGTGTGRSAVGSGQAVVAGIQAGTLTVAVRSESLPYYFQPLAPATIQVPGTSEVRVPLLLQIGRNNPNLYLGLGDSITDGTGSSDGLGYTRKLQDLLGPHFGRAEVREWGRQGDSSAETAEVTRPTLSWFNPAYTLILLGTNDWHDQACQSRPASSCYTVDKLRAIVRDVKSWDSLPVLGTIPPVNPARAPESRSRWYDDMNVLIKAMAAQEQVPVADLNAEMKAAGNLSALFADDVHPNDAGYQLLAQAWFKAITRGRASATSAGAPGFGFRPF